ncbi:hypothetical protein APASM_0774 [Actinosynnema pretiosum subsp. pretiosum]|nr:hypothetical protein APASM_0774 [Actinosynnema pretiosum subsp. pretiosum]
MPGALPDIPPEPLAVVASPARPDRREPHHDQAPDQPAVLGPHPPAVLAGHRDGDHRRPALTGAVPTGAVPTSAAPAVTTRARSSR